jgi:hypothetical protein
MNDDLSSAHSHSFMRPAMLLVACTLVVALLLLPIAFARTGSGGPLGLAAAAAICLLSGWLTEGLAVLLRHSVQPVGLMVIGMAVRMLPPLGICLLLAAQGASGREHLAFIGYLLAFYLTGLAFETWLAVKRVACPTSRVNPSAR